MTFKVQIQPTGHSFTTEGDETVLDAALRHGYAFPYGCRNGGCGACKGRLLEGRLDYDTDLPPALSEEEHGRGIALLCQARAATDLVIEVKEVAASAELRVKTLPTKVHKKELLADDVVRLYLKLPAAERMQYLAGQYIDILLKDGRRRSFSIANPPHDDALLELHIRHVEGGDFTGYIFDKLQTGDVLRIEGPHGDFYLREESRRPLIFMAGGTGFAPLKGIIEHAFAEGLDQPMSLYWGVRSERDLYLADLPRQWQAQRPDFRFIPVLSEPSAGWVGRTGLVHQAIVADHAQGLAAYEVYASGPPLMVKAGFDTFRQHGLDEAHYYSDAFEFQSPKKAS